MTFHLKHFLNPWGFKRHIQHINSNLRFYFVNFNQLNLFCDCHEARLDPGRVFTRSNKAHERMFDKFSCANMAVVYNGRQSGNIYGIFLQ